MILNGCLGNIQRLFCHFWDCIQVLHFGLYCWPWWWTMGSFISCIVGRPVCSLSKTLLAFALLHFVLQGQICLLLQVFLDFLLLHSHPVWSKGNLFLVLFLELLVGLHRPFNFSFFSITGRGIDLDYCDIEWFVLEMNRDHSIIFEIAHKNCILDSFVDYEGYSIFFLRDSCPQ